jgi:hypothetical protein
VSIMFELLYVTRGGRSGVAGQIPLVSALGAHPKVSALGAWVCRIFVSLPVNKRSSSKFFFSVFTDCHNQ